ncbi:hypothetical protein BUALT_Bualt15G0066700 [Buddleja alternifolia]|uniref:1,4-dihydroxy-2-naphthoate octaprenyltransferase n=1 Tax=Buddleja alternifolia TaxID=168488 RepID=A0AAV6WKW9_9LAMI|nr:hypothetical protein BUALT_Bualt15G0066700 [Buddleja alternifolia]
MASTTFCKINIGYRIKKINQELLLNNNNVTRQVQTNSVLYTPHVVQGSYRSYQWTQRRYDESCTSSMVRSKKENAHQRISLESIAEHIDAPTEEESEKGDEISRATLIWRAIKLPMYTVALIPVSVGTAAAYWQTGLYSSWRYFMILASYILVIAWLNLSNDVYDFDTGADKNKKESVVNLFGSRAGINIIAWLLLVLGFVGLTWVAVEARNPRSLILLASAVFCFYLYQCPPFRLSYYGVGEPLLFVAFGPLSTIAFYLLHSRTSELPISNTVVWASILVGLTTSLILFCSHFHQIKDDKAVGKISPLVRLGTEAGSKVVKMAIVGIYSLLGILGVTQILPFASVILCAMTLPMGNLVVSFVEKNHKDKTKIFMSKYYCVRLHTMLGGALAVGLVAARMFATQQLPHPIIL